MSRIGGQGQQPAAKLKPLDVWGVLERILGLGEKKEEEKPQQPEPQPQQPQQPPAPQAAPQMPQQPPQPQHLMT